MFEGEARHRCRCGTLLGLSVTAGCTSSPAVEAQVRVSPDISLNTQPVSMVISQLPAGVKVTARLSNTDSHHVAWTSQATFVANSHGSVNLNTAASLGGSWRGLQPMGLINTLAPVKQPYHPVFYSWPGSSTPANFTLMVAIAGHDVGATTFRRRLNAPSLGTTTQTLSRQGFIGKFVQPPGSSRRKHAALLLIGGSEGGNYNTQLAKAFASHGYPSLSLAYWKEPGLPHTLSHIPLEYFAQALRWLGQQPGVDASRIFVLGESYGSEAAELLGVHFPKLVYGVIGGSPNNAATAAFPQGSGPAWTVRGKPVPFTTHHLPQPTDNPNALIPVERIRGPVFFVCGGADSLWLSCQYAHAMIARLIAHHDTFPHILAEYPEAGHYVDGFVPYWPYWPGIQSVGDGFQSDSNPIALADVWPRLLRFLAVTSRH